MALLPLAGWAVPAAAAIPTIKTGLVYSGADQALVNAGEATAGHHYYYAVVANGAAAPAYGEYALAIPTGLDAGKYDVYYVETEDVEEEAAAPVAADVEDAPHITATIIKKQVVYFLTGGTYAVGDEPDITRHYSLANPGAENFVDGKDLDYYASFTWADTGNDQLDLENGRFTTKKTYNITALKVVPNPGIPQNYDFRFTSTAVIVVTGKSIAGFVADPVAAEQYTGEQITPAAVAIYATAADQEAELALNSDNYDVDYGENINVGATSGKIIYKGKGNYEGTLEVPFAITKRELVSVTVADFTAAFPYSHREIEPELTVTGEDEDGNSYTLAATDYEVNYNGTNINVTDEGATGELTEAEGGNFAFPEDPEDVDDATFMIAPKDLGDADIVITAIDPVYYTADAIEPTTPVKWKIDDNPDHDIVLNDGEGLNIISFDYENNENSGTAAIIASVDENAEGAENYTGSKSLNFMILPTSIDLETITIQMVNEDPAGEEVVDFTEAEYKYTGNEIRPGDNENDGFVLVKDGDAILKKGVDFEIVSYGDNVTIDEIDYTGDNINASKEITETSKKRGTVTIQGKGNYGKITALAEPITKTQTFEIGKKTLELSAVEGRSTTYGVSPIDPVVKFGYTDNTDEDATKTAAELLGGYVTYELYSYDPTAEEPVEELVDEADYTTLGISAANLAYVYKPVWNNLPNVAPEVEEDQPAPVAGVDYQSAAQIAARDNYDIDDELSIIETNSADFTVNAARWIIVPNNQEKKYGVDDAALTFSYKVYNGEKAEANLVDPEEVEFDEEVEPIFGRTEENHGEDVVNGGYTISILNEANVSKVGYTLEYETAKLDILAFPITVKANNQSIYYGENANLEHSETSKVKDVEGDEYGFGNLLTVEISPAMYGNQTLINREVLGLTLKYAEDYDGKAGLHKGALVPKINNTNFAATIIPGDLDVVAAGDLLLSETDDDLAGKIAAANDGEEKVITFDNIPMLEKEWYAMVLPFATSPVELVKAFDTYVVVNTLKNSTIKDGVVTVNFELKWDEIPAGTPFLIKPAEAVNWKDVEFVAPVTEEITVAPSDYATFTGVYEMNKSLKWGYDLDGTKEDGWDEVAEHATLKYRWLANTTDARPNTDPVTYYENKWYNCKNNAHALTPMEAFLILDKTATGARVFVEDFENGTTAIQSLNADEINGLKTSEGWYTIDGIKLQSAPVEKGVYINNGKKVVIK